ncbi:MAG: hypothetical protein HYX33_04550 [Actinobacteria bacterium]|nr:hypothetical protein [Actinomycetota bacterium]
MRSIRTDRAPTPVAGAPYSQAVVAPQGEIVWVSGQLPIDPESGTLLTTSITEQTGRVIANIAAVLAAAGGALSDVVKTTVFLTDLGDFAEMNAAYAASFGASAPARSTIQVAALPLGSPIEIEATAVIRPA